MSIVTIDDKHLTNIANAIRQKNGASDKYNPSEMANAIKNIDGGADPILQNVTVSPKTIEQIITPSEDYDGIGQVKVNAVTSSIDSDIKATNIKKGVDILGVIGTLEEGIKPSGTKTITSNGDYDVTNFANASVNVAGMQPTGTLDITNNGIYDVKNYANANVNVPSSSSYAPRFLRFTNDKYTDLNQELTGIDSSNLVSLASAFLSCTKLISADISHLNTSKVTDISSMFASCSALTDITFGNFDVSSVTNMRYVFKNSKSLINLDLSSWGTCQSKYFSDMFYNCTALESIDLRNLNTTKTGQSVDYMFYGCSSLKHLDMRSFEFSSKTYGSMFYNVPTDCEIIVKDETQKTWITGKFKTLTNVKTLVEYQAEGGV